MTAFYGRILKVDLTAGAFAIETLDAEVTRRYLGGKGLASRLLYDLNPGGVDPLAAENHLIFATGPVTGTRVWGSSRYGVFTKSPQTGFYCESYAGGKVPEAMDAAGFDAVVFSGISPRPTVVVVNPGGAAFHDAGDLWGMETYAAEDAVLARFASGDANGGKQGAVVVGPAAENGVRFAVIENDYWRSAGRSGAGTVMGAKRLKALVFHGDAVRTSADAEVLQAQSKRMAREGRDHPGVQAYKSWGTPMMVKVLNNAGAFPTRYWAEGRCAHWENIGADALHTRCRVTPHACRKCYMACGRMTTVQQGPHAGLTLEGPEYETIYVFGGLCMVDNIEDIVHLNDVCDRQGLDTISAGNLCALAIAAAKRGRIDLPIDYGDSAAIADLLQAIAARQGVGDVLAEGIRFAAAEWNMEDVAVHVKGLEPAGYDPRVLKGMGLAYAVSDRGACHLRATFYKPELAGLIDPDQIEGKAALFKDFEDRATLFDTLILCRFYRDLYPWEELSRLIGAVTGQPAGKADLERIAADVSDCVRRFNLREGLSPEDDRLPPGLYRSLEDSGARIEPQALERMVADYYRLRGWDAEGVPLSAKA